MSRFRNHFLVVAGLAMLVSTATMYAQEQNVHYGGWPTQLQTRNIPAGTVVDPGSQLLYIADTGVNLRTEFGAEIKNAQGQVINTPLINLDPFKAGGAKAIYNAQGGLVPERVFQNFIAITNTHPTQAVTIHFRYFNDECVDVLDFLVLLTCNDTLIFDPFNFLIPGTNFNTRTRIFGPAQGPLAPIGANLFASGRFLIFATAAGASTDANDNAELRFPFEFKNVVNANHHCTNLRDNTWFGTTASLSSTNLHVFNASAVAFNYLMGHFTAAVPRGFIDLPGDNQLAYGVNAWTRPAVDLTGDASTNNTSTFGDSEGDGDGPPLVGLNDYRILGGSEPMLQADGVNSVVTNALYLRNEVHGGDTDRVQIGGDATLDYQSFYGALGWTSLHGTNSKDQLVHFLSAIDDYNGSRHAADDPVAGFKDRSYNMNGATTVYVLQLYDNNENLFNVAPETPINISPVPPGQPLAELKITVDCLRVWVTSTKSPGTSVDDFQISDLSKITPAAEAHVSKAPASSDVDQSRGWIRFVRDNSARGTWAIANRSNDAAGVGSFTTIGLTVVKFQSFGASWWLSSSASSPAVSRTGKVAP